MASMKTSGTITEETGAGFARDETGSIQPTIENFYKFCAEGKLMALKCNRCGAIICPPRIICPTCFHDRFEWNRLRGRGRLLTYTVIHFPPTQFQALAPYAVGIVKLEEGPHLPGMIRNVKPEELRIGMEVEVDFETALPKEWPRWPRYFFRATS